MQGESAYGKIANILGDRIAKGIYERGQQLPSEHDLATEFSVSRVTINRALQQLQQAGLVSARRGIGMFVNPPAEWITMKELPAYIAKRLASGDRLLFRRPDGSIEAVNVPDPK